VFYWQLRQRPQSSIVPAAGAGLVIVAAIVLALDSGNTEGWTVMLALGLVVVVIFNVLVPLTPGRIRKRFGAQIRGGDAGDLRGEHRATHRSQTTPCCAGPCSPRRS
jgi:hypothetical protein